MSVFTVRNNIRYKNWLQFLVVTAFMVLISVLSYLIRFRVDLTEDRRFTLSKQSHEILDNIKTDIYIQVYLDGDLPIPLKRLRRSVMELLDEFRIASDRKIDYDFINPSEAGDAQARESQYQALYSKGLNPVNIQAGDEEGGSSQKIIFPGMIVNLNGIEVPVNFLKNNQSIPYEQNILHSIEGLEYEMIQTLATLNADTVYKVAFLEGQGEYSEVEVADITLNLAKFFTVDRGAIEAQHGILDQYSAIIVAGPVEDFSEADKLVIDQYIMNGGKVLWLMEEVLVNADSLVYGETVGLYHPLNIEDQLFRYGARINPVIVQDMDCMLIQLTVMTGNEQKQVVPAPWVYYPLLTPSPDHPITKNLNKIKGEFSNYIDTVGLDPSVRKTILLTSSEFTKTVSPPLLISLREAERLPSENDFNKSKLPVAILLEGIFPSAYKNRMTGSLVKDEDFILKTESSETKMIVVADGDIIRNDVRRTGNVVTPYPLGQDRYTGQMFGNRDFIINCLNYLVDDYGIMDLRSREMKLRLLSSARIKNERLRLQIINIIGPVLMVILSGLIVRYFRRIKYTRY